MIQISLTPSFLSILTALNTSFQFAMPVERATGFRIAPIAEIKRISVISGDAILYAGQLELSKTFKAAIEKGEAKTVKLIDFP